MKTTLLTFAICLGSIIGFSQDLKPFQDVNGKFGFMSDDGKVVIPAIYDEVSYNCNNGENAFFDDGTMAVSQNYKWGFIDNQGKIIVPLIYDRVYEFKEGLACVAKGGILDTSGSYSRYKKSKYGFIDKNGKTVIPFNFDNTSSGCDYDAGFYGGLAALSKKGKYGFIDKKGKVVIDFKFDEIIYGRGFMDGIKSGVLMDGKKYYIDKTGKILEEIKE